jgi:hypothetical protein
MEGDENPRLEVKTEKEPALFRQYEKSIGKRDKNVVVTSIL